MKTVEYLDLAKQCAGLPSDYALAHRIGVTPQAVSSWRSASRPRYPEVLHALMLADICRLDPVKVLSDIEMDKATHYDRTKELAAWHALLSRVSNATTEYVSKTTGTVVNQAAADAGITLRKPRTPGTLTRLQRTWPTSANEERLHQEPFAI